MSDDKIFELEKKVKKLETSFTIMIVMLVVLIWLGLWGGYTLVQANNEITKLNTTIESISKLKETGKNLLQRFKNR